MAASRTLTPDTWLATATHNPQLPDGPLSKIALDALASAREPNMSSTMTRAARWPHPGGPLLGAMWLGVIKPTYTYRDAGGCWMLQTTLGAGEPVPAYMRLVPAGDGEVQYGFCPLKLDRRASLMEALFPDGEIRLNTCTIRVESTALIRIDKIAVSAAQLQDADTTEGRRFRELLGRLRIPLGDLVEDMFRNVYSDRSTSILRDRSEDYRDVVHLLVDRSYPGTLPPATILDVKRFLACVVQDSPYVWTPETIFPSLGSVVLPDEVCSKVARNLEAGLPPIVPQWYMTHAYQFNGPWARPCTGIEYGGRDDKLLAGVCNSFNTDLMGPLGYWPPDWHPPSEWLDAYMDVLDEVHTMAVPVDTNHRTDLLLETARKVPVILQGRSGPVFARVVSFEITSGRNIESVQIQESTAAGVLLPGQASVVETDSSPDLDEDQDGEEDTGECGRCGLGSADLSACGSCGGFVCDECWDGSCDECGDAMCAGCGVDHDCEGRN